MKKTFLILLCTAMPFLTLANRWEGDYIVEFTSEGFDLELHLYVYETPKGLRAQCSGLGRMYAREILFKGVEKGDNLQLIYMRDNFPGRKEAYDQFRGKVMLQLSDSPLELTAYDDYLISFEEGEAIEVFMSKNEEGSEYKHKNATE